MLTIGLVDKYSCQRMIVSVVQPTPPMTHVGQFGSYVFLHTDVKNIPLCLNIIEKKFKENYHHDFFLKML